MTLIKKLLENLSAILRGERAPHSALYPRGVNTKRYPWPAEAMESFITVAITVVIFTAVVGAIVGTVVCVTAGLAALSVAAEAINTILVISITVITAVLMLIIIGAMVAVVVKNK